MALTYKHIYKHTHAHTHIHTHTHTHTNTHTNIDTNTETHTHTLIWGIKYDLPSHISMNAAPLWLVVGLYYCVASRFIYRDLSILVYESYFKRKGIKCVINIFE